MTTRHNTKSTARAAARVPEVFIEDIQSKAAELGSTPADVMRDALSMHLYGQSFESWRDSQLKQPLNRNSCSDFGGNN